MQKNTAEQHQFSDTDSGSTTEVLTPDTDQALIALAVSLVGDRSKVMKHIRCSEADFLSYCSGEKELHLPQLHRLVSLIIDEQRIAMTKHGAPLNLVHPKQRGSNVD